ncbi:lysophospholipid acyltransferase family protein [Pontivivens insulae]|uniref:Lipid A biosynthesis lauroyltransferase n=1 Tax=Pontivivens insulae TaxID=1639689 RepID=A0A2R8AD67_9RHOB|nr:lysophospholipid acyltransferase family protein [Pontivivens insulae]RED13941.1 KDO2-lipid IV(A) lauroyltransferase [Pontivivens insulae]SPF30015.1 Lipid A biosynthesis lauroyltransferase [Pontivivens insulae]
MSKLTDLGHRLSNGVLRVGKQMLRPLRFSTRLRVGSWVGRKLLVRLPAARKRFDRNIELIFPKMSMQARRTFLEKVGDNTGRVLIEEMFMDEVVHHHERFRSSGPGWDAYRAALQDGKGALMVSAHFGNWEGMRIISRFNFDAEVAGVYRPHNNPYYNDDFVSALNTISPQNFPKGRHGTRDLVRHLRGGGVAAILIDQKQSGSPLIPFLGQPAETTLTAAKLAKSQGIPVYPALTYRNEDGVTFDCWLGDAILHDEDEVMMRAMNDALSAKILERPEQWFWFHRRWR